MKRSLINPILLVLLSCSLFIVHPIHAEPAIKNSVYSFDASMNVVQRHHSSPKLKHSMPAAHHRHKMKRISKKRVAKKRTHTRVLTPAFSSRFKQPAYLKQQDQFFSETSGQDMQPVLPSVDLVYKTVDSLSYSHYKLGANRFDLNEGVFVVDCSSYVDRVLLETFPFAYRHFTDTMQTDRPTTEHYYRFFKQLSGEQDNPYWGKVDAVDELKAGDILVFRYRNAHGRTSGGHVMMVMEKPKKASDGYLVKVADSASTGHSNDTRSKGISGIGIGTMRLKAHPETGKPFAFSWKIGTWWKRNVDIIMGRPAGRSHKLDAA